MADGAGRRIEAVAVERPEESRAAPVVFDSPHSGEERPEDFAPAVPVESLLGFADRFVDRLVADAPRFGVPLVVARFPRAYVDPNRAPDDLDEQVAGEDWTEPRNPSAYSAQGIGLIFRTALCGSPIYERPLTRAEINRRIERYWRPFHDALAAELEAAVGRWGAVWHLDWHSMRPFGDAAGVDPGARRPDFVVSDAEGTTSEPAFLDWTVETLRAAGFTVAVNHPFKGGHVIRRHGRPGAGVHSLQVEINRGLYLDMETLEKTPDAETLRAALARFAEACADYARGRVSAS